MSGKQNNNTASNEETYINPCFPNLILKKVNGKDVVVGVRDEVRYREVNSTAKINIKTNNK